MLDLEKNDFLTKEQIRKAAPSIFTTEAGPETSDKYTHIPTSVIIDDMEKLGWSVVDCKEVKARKSSTKGFQKHLIVFRNPEIVIIGDDGDDVFPQVLLTNSHDGKNAFTFTAGLFRMVCENGLVISTQQFEDVKMRHMGYKFEELQEEIRAMVEKLPLTVESMNKMKKVKLDAKKKLKFAKEALKTRFPEEEMKRIKVDFKDLIDPIRKEDEGDDLWSVFNVVQEKIIEGDFNYNAGGKSRKARQIKNFNQDLKINKELFSLALEFAS